jgi:hypothetical protein
VDAEERDLGVRGGQGHSARELSDSSLLWACMILLAAVCVVVLTGCQHLNRIGPL